MATTTTRGPIHTSSPIRHGWADAAAAILGYLIANLDGVDVDAMNASANEYIAQLESLDTEVAETFANLTDDQRVLVTNHEGLRLLR